MSEHPIDLSWARGDQPFERGKISQEHLIRFQGGQTLTNSSAAGYGGSSQASNPEELLAASIGSCHMLTFLAVAANRGWIIDRYEDHSVAYLDKNDRGQPVVTRIDLHPRVIFGGDKQPDQADVTRMHERAHQACFIANSVKSEVKLNL